MESIGRATGQERTLPTDDQIRARAYEIYQSRDGQSGNPESDWYQAQRELVAALSQHDGATKEVKTAVAAAPASPAPVGGKAQPRDDVKQGSPRSSASTSVTPVVKATQPARRGSRGKASR